MKRLRGEQLLDALERGEVRAAEPDGEGWRVNAWVKEELLAIFRGSPVVSHGGGFTDKAALGTRGFGPQDGVRLVPGGSAVRRGAYLGRGVVCMPPMYVNVGAHVGDGAMIDSHALVGTCAQVGARVHVSAGVQIGGVLEPPGAWPVRVEEGAFLGAQCGLFEGVCVGAGAVLAAGTILTGGGLLHDLVHERTLRGTRSEPLHVPPGAVVVPGARPARSDWARERGLQVACALVVKYRDRGTDAAVALEDALR